MIIPVPETKVCTGPAHPGPTALPVDSENWYFHKTGPREGQPTSRCRLCTNWDRLSEETQGMSGLIDCKKVLRFATELVDRCDGVSSAARLSGVSENTLWAIFGTKQCTIQKRTAQKIISALAEKRRTDRRDGAISERFKQARKAQALLEERMERDLS